MACMASRSDLVKKWLSKSGDTPSCSSHVASASSHLLTAGYHAPERELQRQSTSAVDFDLATQSETDSSSNSDLEGMYAFDGTVQGAPADAAPMAGESPKPPELSNCSISSRGVSAATGVGNCSAKHVSYKN